MKLAEALMLRSDAKQKLASLYERIKDNAIVPQDDKLHEDPAELLNEAVGVVDQIESLVIRINRANLENQLADGQTLMEAFAARDSLTKQHALLHAAIEGAKREPDEYQTSGSGSRHRRDFELIETRWAAKTRHSIAHHPSRLKALTQSH